MTHSDKPKRAYNSTRRQAQAQQTRQQITDAARKLFTERGYAGATIEAIAQEAGVAPDTVYTVFGSKQKILSHLMDSSIGREDASMPVLQHPVPQAVLHATDQRQQLEMLAGGITSLMDRAAPIFEIMRVAAKTEPDIAEVLQNLQTERWQNMQVVIQRIADNGPLREGLTVPIATDIVWTLMSAEVFRLLTDERGWSKEKYRDWLLDSLTRQLLP